MASVADILRILSAYPVPEAVARAAAEGQGLDPSGDAVEEVTASRGYKLASAAVLDWVADAPNVSQCGVSYNLADEQRRILRERAAALRQEVGVSKTRYGYKGHRL